MAHPPVKTTKSLVAGNRAPKSGPLCMGKKRTCIFPYKSVPPQQVPYTLTVARRFQAQSTSVNICEGEGKCDDSTGGIWVFDPGSL